MRFTPPEPEIPEIGGFTDSNDIFSYREFAERLSNLVQNIDEPLVIALDGPWGSGKSVFIKQWAGLLRQRGATAIYFDAFANDHYEDAFLAISSEIHATAKTILGTNKSITRRYLNKAKKAGMVLTPIALRIASRTMVAGIDLEAGKEIAEAAVKSLGDEAAKGLEKAVSERLRKASEERATLDAFRLMLSETARALASQCAEQGDGFPLIFIIDDLDRCRPPFALSVIERIKHMFSVNGLCFVLVSHLPQLHQAVQGAYGSTFDARTYLEKFYHLRLILPEGAKYKHTNISSYASHLWNVLGIQFNDSRYNELIRKEIQALAEGYQMSLRSLERMMVNLVLVCAAAGPRHLIIPPIVAGLCVMRQTHPELYKKARAGNLTWSEAQGFLMLPRPNEGQGWIEGWWKYSIGEDMPNEERANYASSLFRYNVDEPRELIPLMSKYIDNLQRHAGSDQ